MIGITLLQRHTLILLVMVSLSCSSNSTGTTDTGDSDPHDNDQQEYSLLAEASPADGGTVSPTSGTYDAGTSVTVEASSNEGWKFESWGGDLSSEDNPVTFTIDQNTSIKAEFRNISSLYDVKLTLSDSLDDMDLWLGQKEKATEAFDEGMDFEAPPDPPQNALNGYFEQSEGLRLFKDYRSSLDTSAIWRLRYSIGTGDTLQVAWNLSVTRLDGSLMLRNDDSSIYVNMLEEDSVRVKSSSADSLFIEYTLNSE